MEAAGRIPMTTESAALSTRALLRLASWLSPSFPTSPYAYSHGLERLAADGEIDGLASFLGWASTCLEAGAGRNDGILLAEAWRAASLGDGPRLADAAELAAALQPSAERRRETLDQGAAFLRTAAAVWPEAASIEEALGPEPPRRIAYPVAVGAAAGRAGCPLAPTIALSLHAYCGMLVVAGQKLVPLGQTDAQRALARLSDRIETLAAEIEAADLDDLGGSALRADIASMRHETQEVRLYRS